MSHATAPTGATAKLRWEKEAGSGVYWATAGRHDFAITPHWTAGRNGRKLSHFVVTHNEEHLARVDASEKAALSAAKRWANARFNAILEQGHARFNASLAAQVEVSHIAAQVNAEQDRVARYVAQLEAMTQVQLMDELELCVRQNHMGSHDAQKRLVRAELGQRCSH